MGDIRDRLGNSSFKHICEDCVEAVFNNCKKTNLNGCDDYISVLGTVSSYLCQNKTRSDRCELNLPSNQTMRPAEDFRELY